MGKKHTIEYIKERMKEINYEIKILDESYIGTFEKLNCQCMKCGKILKISWDKLSQGQGCNNCNKTPKFTIEEIIEKLNKINDNIILLSANYTRSKDHLKCKCKIDGYEWYASWNNLSRGRGCPKCSNKINFSFEEVKEQIKIINPNVTIYCDNYKNVETKVKCLCLLDGHEWCSRVATLKSGKGCPKCAGHINITLDEIKLIVEENNKSTEILTKEYLKSKDKLTCFCKEHDFIWETTWNNLRYANFKCPKCGRKNAGDLLRLSTKEVRCEFEKLFPNLELLSEYINAKTPLIYRCRIDGEIFDSLWYTLLNKNFKGCPKCNNIKKAENKRNKLIAIHGEEYVNELYTKRRYKDYDENIMKWRNDVLKRDNYICAYCKDKNSSKQTHHINSYNWAVSERFDTNNGITLCKKCHKNFHKEYGLGNNTQEQFAEWINTRLEIKDMRSAINCIDK